MNREETLAILAVLKLAYPSAFRDLGRTDAEATVRLWQKHFADVPYEEADLAVSLLIDTRGPGYTPTIGEVKNLLRGLRAPEGLGAEEAWALVSKACRNGLYGSREEFAKLPPEVRSAVGSPERLRAWAAMDRETVESVVASNFMRGYRAHAAREKELALLPAAMRGLAGSLAGSPGMPGAEKEKPALGAPGEKGERES